MSITKLKWDSDFFGFNVGMLKIEINTFCEELNELLKKAKQENFKLLYLKINKEYITNDPIKSKCIFNKGGKLVDEKVTYSIELENYSKTPRNNEIIEYNKQYSAEIMRNLAIQSSHKSRYRMDLNFEKTLCDKMYCIWMDKSIEGKLADKIFIYTEGDKPTGFITLTIKNKIGNIVLIGVDKEMRGKKVGSKLIYEAFNYFKEKNIKYVNVDTQLANSTACNFYENCNFKVSKILNIYHFWN